MSLIDDALRKAGEQSSSREAPTDRPSSWIPAYRPDRRARRLRMIRRLSFFAALAAGVGLAFWLAFRGKADRAAPVAVRPSVSAPVATSLPEVVVAPPPREHPPGRSGVSAPAAALDRAPAQQDSGRTTTPASVPREPAREPAAAARLPERPAAERPARGVADGKSYRGEVTLPDGGKITLDGIAYSETHPVAVLNGRVLETGGIVEEFVIVSIKPDRVELKGRGMTIFLDLK